VHARFAQHRGRLVGALQVGQGLAELKQDQRIVGVIREPMPTCAARAGRISGSAGK
jgi:hypothetical protein